MTVRERFVRAWPTTFGVHVFQMLLAGTFAVPAVASVAVPELAVRESVAAWIAAMRLGFDLRAESVRYALAPLVVAALAYPILRLAWLRACEQPEPLAAHARYALTRYRAAAGAALGALLGWALALAAAGGSSLALQRMLGGSWDDRSTDLAVLGGLLPFAGAALWWVTLEDAVYAGLARGARSLRAAVRAAFAATTPTLVGLRALFVAGQCAFGLLAWLGARLVFGTGGFAEIGVLLATQLAAIGLTSARAAWFALLLSRMKSPPLGDGV